MRYIMIINTDKGYEMKKGVIADSPSLAVSSVISKIMINNMNNVENTFSAKIVNNDGREWEYCYMINHEKRKIDRIEKL